MSNGSKGRATHDGNATTIGIDVAAMNDAELSMALAEWRRWRYRVMSSPVMNRREERFNQAELAIAAIEEERALRDAAVRGDRRDRAKAALSNLVETTTPSLESYRQLRDELALIDRYAKRQR